MSRFAMNRTTTTAIVAIVIVAAAFLVGRCSGDRVGSDTTVERVRRVDTMTVVRYRDSVVLRYVRPTSTREQTPEDWVAIGHPDTPSVAVDPFVDSASVRFPSGDTVDVAFAYPQRIFTSVMLRPRPDTSTTITITDSVTVTKHVRTPIGVGAFGGYGFSADGSHGWTVGVGVVVQIWSFGL